MRKYMYILILSFLFLCGCGNAATEVHAEPRKTPQPEKRFITVESDSALPTYEEVLFMEIPESRLPAKSFLESLEPFDIFVANVKITDYGYGTYQINCEFTDEVYNMTIYVRPDKVENMTRWYGTLRKGKEVALDWHYYVKGIVNVE